MVKFSANDADVWEVDDDVSYPDDEDDYQDHDDETAEFDEAEAEAGAAPEPQFATVVEFVETWFVPVIRRRVSDTDGGLSWDARWWAYPEVVARLTALWYAWEEARASDSMSAMSVWWVNHLEPHLRVILDGDTGPMANAKSTGEWMGWPAMPLAQVPAGVLDLLEET